MSVRYCYQFGRPLCPGRALVFRKCFAACYAKDSCKMSGETDCCIVRKYALLHTSFHSLSRACTDTWTNVVKWHRRCYTDPCCFRVKVRVKTDSKQFMMEEGGEEQAEPEAMQQNAPQITTPKVRDGGDSKAE